tara:strand:- start:97 stop:321 length:225 start_codon:yes stop_codon:yes gene_type:complete
MVLGGWFAWEQGWGLLAFPFGLFCSLASMMIGLIAVGVCGDIIDDIKEKTTDSHVKGFLIGTVISLAIYLIYRS